MFDAINYSNLGNRESGVGNRESGKNPVQLTTIMINDKIINS